MQGTSKQFDNSEVRLKIHCAICTQRESICRGQGRCLKLQDQPSLPSHQMLEKVFFTMPVDCCGESVCV